MRGLAIRFGQHRLNHDFGRCGLRNHRQLDLFRLGLELRVNESRSFSTLPVFGDLPAPRSLESTLLIACPGRKLDQRMEALNHTDVNLLSVFVGELAAVCLGHGGDLEYVGAEFFDC